MRRGLAYVLIAGLTPMAAAAGGIADGPGAVLRCIDAMHQGASWQRCLNLLVAPCDPHRVGSDAHLGCLAGQRDDWQLLMQQQQGLVMRALTPGGASELTQLMSGWIDHVGGKCAEVGAAKAAISEEAARLGCEMSEMAVVTAEFVACRDGRSKSPYCEVQE